MAFLIFRSPNVEFIESVLLTDGEHMFEIVPGKGVKSDQGLGCRDAFKSRKFHGDRVRDLLIALDTNDCHQILPSGD